MSLDIDITDMFCGCGGSTTGAVQVGVNVRYAINHWDRAIETHNTNYPNVKHVLTDLHVTNPKKFERTTGLIASPECTNHSLAKGKRKKQQGGSLPGFECEMTLEDEAAERSRCTMWTPLDWAEHHRYEFVILENVVDIGGWAPFEAWLHAWQSLGYDFELCPVNSMHIHPVPQSRDRIYFVAWRKGNPRPDLKITPRAYCHWCETDVDALRAWKKPEAWTNYRLQCGRYKFQYVYACPVCNKEVIPYYYAAINAIDWSLPVVRIGERTEPLAPKTIERIEHGLKKFQIQPFLVDVTKSSDRLHAVTSDPFPTQTKTNGQALVVPSPFLINTSHSECKHSSYVVDPGVSALPTQTTRQDLALALPPRWEYWVLTYYGNGQFVPIENALPTVPGNDHHAFMTTPIQSTPITVEDCGFRMLEPHEIQKAMAFPAEYILTGNKKERVKMLGNAVTPPVMKFLVDRVVASLDGGAA